MVAPDIRSEVADPCLSRWTTPVGALVRDGVINIDAAADCGGIGEYIRWIAKLELFAETGRNLVAVDRAVSGGEVDHRSQVDCAAVAQQESQPAEQHRPGVLDSGDSGTGRDGLGADMHIDHGPRPCLFGIERRWCDL